VINCSLTFKLGCNTVLPGTVFIVDNHSITVGFSRCDQSLSVKEESALEQPKKEDIPETAPER
jgi:hypothetical protein